MNRSLVLPLLLLVACAPAVMPRTALKSNWGAASCPAEAIAADTSGGGVVYFACQVRRPAHVLANSPPPSYPKIMEWAGAEGDVRMQFVVDTHGAVQPSSVRMQRTSHELFTLAARAALRASRWQPAVRRGRAVSQLVVHTYVYQLAKDSAGPCTPTDSPKTETVVCGHVPPTYRTVPAYRTHQDEPVDQAARIGRLPVLAPLRATGTPCGTALPITAELQRDGIESGVLVRDTLLARTVSLALTADGHAKVLLAMMSDSTGAQRRELETVTVVLGPDGRVLTGSRSAMTSGTPSRASEDRRGGLLPADTAQAIALAAAIRACGRR